MNQKKPLPLVRLSLILPFVRELDRRRIDTRAVLAENGLVRDTALDPNVFVPPIVIHRFLESAARAAEDPHFSVHVGETLDWASWPPLVDAVSRAKTLGELLTRFILAVRDEASSAQHFLEVGPAFAFFKERRTSEQEIAPAQNDAFTAAFALALISRATGSGWRPEDVWLTVCDPRALSDGYMGVHIVRGDRMGMTVRFPSGWLLEPFDQQAFAARAQRGHERSEVPTAFVDALRQALMPNLHATELGVDFVARLIGVSRQSLQRRLKASGTTLSAEIGEMKKRRAIEALTHTDKSVADIAELLGFENPTSFSRAFRSWTGASPRKYRRSHRVH